MIVILFTLSIFSIFIFNFYNKKMIIKYLNDYKFNNNVIKTTNIKKQKYNKIKKYKSKRKK